MAGFIPGKDADLLVWSKANSAVITANPVDVLLTPAIATTYAGLVADFEEKLLAAKAENAGKTDRIRKDQARKDLVAYARAWARNVQGNFAVTEEIRSSLGISLRNNPGTPINAPTQRPVMQVLSADGLYFKLSIRAIGAEGKAKLSGTDGAVVFTYVGSAPEPDMSKWTLQGQVTRNDLTIEMPSTLQAGSQVWFRCAWYSPRGQYGPPSTPICAYVGGSLGDIAPEILPTMFVDGSTGEAPPQLKAA